MYIFVIHSSTYAASLKHSYVLSFYCPADIFYSCSSCSLFSVLFIPVKLKVFSISVNMNPGKSFLLPASPFPLFFVPLLTKFIFLLVHHRSTIDQSTKESNGNETETKQIKARGGVVCCMWVGEMVRINVLVLAFFFIPLICLDFFSRQNLIRTPSCTEFYAPT